MGLFNRYLKQMGESGALKQILKQYESGGQVCPDMSGQPLGFSSCFTAFVVLLCGLAIGLALMVLECISRWTKLKFSWLEVYGRSDNVELDNMDPNNWSAIISQKNEIIFNLEARVKLLKRKIHKLSESKALKKPWYEKLNEKMH